MQNRKSSDVGVGDSGHYHNTAVQLALREPNRKGDKSADQDMSMMQLTPRAQNIGVPRCARRHVASWVACLCVATHHSWPYVRHRGNLRLHLLTDGQAAAEDVQTNQ